MSSKMPPGPEPHHGASVPPPEAEDRRLRRRTRRIFLRCVELIAVAVSFLGRNAIARFLAAKAGLDLVVEVTARFGADTGHRLSTIVAAIIAEPRLIAVIVVLFFLIFHLLAWLIRLFFRPRRRRRPYSP